MNENSSSKLQVSDLEYEAMICTLLNSLLGLDKVPLSIDFFIWKMHLIKKTSLFKASQEFQETMQELGIANFYE